MKISIRKPVKKSNDFNSFQALTFEDQEAIKGGGDAIIVEDLMEI